MKICIYPEHIITQRTIPNNTRNLKSRINRKLYIILEKITNNSMAVNAMDKYKNKYRIPTNRLRGYDYASNGCYYVTICTKNREHYFGEITVETNVETDNYPSLQNTMIHKMVQKTKISEVAEEFWTDIPNHFPFVLLDQFVIMPNHIHGILFFNKKTTSWQASPAQLFVVSNRL